MPTEQQVEQVDDFDKSYEGLSLSECLILWFLDSGMLTVAASLCIHIPVNYLEAQ
jgi:hypothetical protein